MFKSIGLAGLMHFSAISAFAIAPHINNLAISRSESGPELGCALDKLCIEIAPSQTGCEGEACSTTVANRKILSLKSSGGQLDPAYTSYQLTGLSSSDEEYSPHLWPKLIRFEGGILVGVETEERAMYSGGGGGSTTLHLIAFLSGQPPFKVLSVSQSANMTIRACFNERDMKQRAGVCHDDYNFDAGLVLTGTSIEGMPVLRYRSTATSFPGRVSRSEDSLAKRPLRKRDIVTVTDPQCSYQRLYRFKLEAHGYVPDTPPPDCSEYTVP